MFVLNDKLLMVVDELGSFQVHLEMVVENGTIRARKANREQDI